MKAKSTRVMYSALGFGAWAMVLCSLVPAGAQPVPPPALQPSPMPVPQMPVQIAPPTANLLLLQVPPTIAAATVGQKIRGFADLHNHQHNNLGFGGNGVWGSAFRRGNETMEQVLRWCTEVHGPGGVNDLLSQFFGLATHVKGPSDIGHHVGGYPEFDGWPRWDSLTHQTVYEDWLLRAHQGGLQLIVMLAGNSEKSCDFFKLQAPGRTCDDMEAIDREVKAAKEMEAEIDRRSGGTGKGWYRLVYTPRQARDAIARGQLAVVLGAEIDNLFDCYASNNCNEAAVSTGIQKLYDLGLRYLFPIHFTDNQFGGTALHIGLQYTRPTAVTTVHNWYGVYATSCGDKGYAFDKGRCNTRGLSDLGRFFIRTMMSKGMLFDIDHSSRKSMDDMLELAQAADYPVMASHARFLDIAVGDNRSEAQKTRQDLLTIRKLGGMVAPLGSQGSLDETITWPGAAAKRIFHTCPESAESWAQAYLYAVQTAPGMPIGIGTDFNGFAYPPGPRFGPDACRLKDVSVDHIKQLQSIAPQRVEMQMRKTSYPFNALANGVRLDKSVVGRKVFDINVDGMAHVGMLPDFIAELQAIGLTNQDLEPLMNSAEGFVQAWEKAVARKVAAPSVQVWSEKPAGTFYSSEGDIIEYKIAKGAVESHSVQFVLALGQGITWEKQLNVPDGEGKGSNWTITVHDTGESARAWMNLRAHQTQNGQQITFRKKKGLLQGLAIWDVLKLGDLQGLQPGTLVTFTWVRDD